MQLFINSFLLLFIFIYFYFSTHFISIFLLLFLYFTFHIFLSIFFLIIVNLVFVYFLVHNLFIVTNLSLINVYVIVIVVLNFYWYFLYFCSVIYFELCILHDKIHVSSLFKISFIYYNMHLLYFPYFFHKFFITSVIFTYIFL